ncbi:MAG: sulfite oxidase heme-binding subunit YedZ, partial [Rhodobacterales bacterium]
MAVTKVINFLMRKLPNWVVYIILVLPAVYLTFALLGNQLGPDPIRTYQHKVGEFGLKLIIIGLFITPLRDLFNINFFKFRRCIGLMAFLYVCLHFLSYLVLDQSLNFNEVWKDIVKRPYI